MPTRKNDRNPVFASNIRQLRISFDMSQDELAEALKVPSRHGGAIVSGWERGEREPSLAMVCKIADIFGVTTDSLLGRDIHTPLDNKIYSLLVKGQNKMSIEDMEKLTKIINIFISN